MDSKCARELTAKHVSSIIVSSKIFPSGSDFFVERRAANFPSDCNATFAIALCRVAAVWLLRASLLIKHNAGLNATRDDEGKHGVDLGNGANKSPLAREPSHESRMEEEADGITRKRIGS
jgi:hypothetical protein